MCQKNKEIDVLKRLFETPSDKDKQQFLAEIICSKSIIQKVIQSCKVTNCPHYQSSHIVKNGKRNGRQNFRCRSCNKAFVEQMGAISFSMKKDIGVLEKYVHCMIEKYSLRKCAEICNINLTTAFAWRHKILDALQKMMPNVELDVVQADETFTTISYNGNHRNFKLPRPSHKRGIKASKRGLSKEQVFIPVAVNLNRLSVTKITNLGRPDNVANLQKVLNGKIAKDSVFVIDSLRSYQKLSFDMKLHHIQIPRNKFKSGVFNIQMVNNYHKRLKDLILGTCKGVVTKYLKNYLVYHNFVNFAKETKVNKEVVLFDFIRNTFCQSRTYKISDRPALPILS